MPSLRCKIHSYQVSETLVAVSTAEGPRQSISVEAKRAQLRQETRARLLRAVQQTYEDIFERAHVAPAHLYKLKNSANRALDHTRDPLCDWKYLDNSCHIPTWLKLLQR